MVNDSRQVLQEPDFTQLLLRDPNTPIVRKSRGTSTQGTSTHASSTHLAMLDEPPSASTSRAGSVRSARSKMSSYHGSLHRDGRWVPTSRSFINPAHPHSPEAHFCSSPFRYTSSSFRAADERLPYGSLPRLNHQSQSRHCSTNHLDNLSRHGSAQRLENQSRHSSIRDLSSGATAVLGVPRNGIHRVLEEDGATA